MTEYFKVIRADRTSAFMTDPKFRVTYPVNQWTVPTFKGSKLAAFTSIDRAESWMQRGLENGIKLICVPCEVKNPTTTSMGIPLIHAYGWHHKISTTCLEDFWNKFNKYAKKYGANKGLAKIGNRISRCLYAYTTFSHSGSVMCSAIKCLK